MLKMIKYNITIGWLSKGMCNFSACSNFVAMYINFVRICINYVWTLRVLLLFFLCILVLVAVYNKPVNGVSISCLILIFLSLEPMIHSLKFI